VDRSDGPRLPDLIPNAATSDQLAGDCPGGPTTLTIGVAARRVLGQADFTSVQANRGGAASAATLSRPVGLSVFQNQLWVSDDHNNRVLAYPRLPGSDGEAALSLIGQPDFATTTATAAATGFTTPQGLWVDSAYLVVAEFSSSRISFWPHTATQAAFCWGQASCTTGEVNQGGLSLRSLNNPAFVMRAGSTYLTADSHNNRVLLHDALQLGDHLPASRVVGQPDGTTNASGSSDSQLYFPLGIASDGTRLVIVDAYNNRLLIYNSIPTADGAKADLAWGSYGTSATQLVNPVGATLDGNRLFVSDRGNHRILVFKSLPTSPSQPADLVLGQSSMTAGSSNQGGIPSASTLNQPHFMHWDGCRLYVADAENHRVLIY